VQGPASLETATEPSTGETVAAAPRRGRPPGPAKARINVSGVETCLLGIHQTLAMAFGISELAMNDEEAAQVAKSYVDVAEFYPVLQLPPKQLALVNFGSTLAIVYGAKFAAYKMRRAMSRPSVVTPIRPAPSKTTGAGVTTETPAFAAPPAQAPNGVDYSQAEVGPIDPKLRTGEIPGVGSVVFPEDHPMFGKKH
jgi:hypothetical protein